MPALYADPKNFTAAALHTFTWSNGEQDRTLYVNAYKSFDGWVLFMDKCTHPEFKDGGGDRNLIALASTRNPGDSRSFKTLDALHNEAKRLADTAGARLELAIRG
jgi:hypothetical protein